MYILAKVLPQIIGKHDKSAFTYVGKKEHHLSQTNRIPDVCVFTEFINTIYDKKGFLQIARYTHCIK